MEEPLQRYSGSSSSRPDKLALSTPELLFLGLAVLRDPVEGSKGIKNTVLYFGVSTIYAEVQRGILPIAYILSIGTVSNWFAHLACHKSLPSWQCYDRSLKSLPRTLDSLAER